MWSLAVTAYAAVLAVAAVLGAVVILLDRTIAVVRKAAGLIQAWRDLGELRRPGTVGDWQSTRLQSPGASVGGHLLHTPTRTGPANDYGPNWLPVGAIVCPGGRVRRIRDSNS